MNISALETVPVIIDDIKSHGEFRMSRCNYFSIEAGESALGRSLGLRTGEPIPLFLLGTEEIITSYDLKGNLFSSARAIQGFFDRIESAGNLIVDINDIWLPNFVFGDFLEIGNLFRVSKDIFTQAYRFRNSIISEKEFIQACQELNHEISYSEEETISFSQWAQMQVELTRDRFFPNAEQRLGT